MSANPHRYFVIYKPFNMVSQFVSPDDVKLLGDLEYDFPEGTHAIGRLDSHSEGLLILTTNKKVTRLLFQGEIPHKRTYVLQVLNVMDEESLQKLRDGVSIRISGDEYWVTSRCEADIINKPDSLFPVANELLDFIPHTWLRLTLTEGKFHQVRKMVLALRHKCRRLIRVSIEDLRLDGLAPGKVREIEEQAFFKLLRIENWE
ncbi:ribosomal large subunit pseudouridine synthase E [Filimonas sp.]|nr:ribosomal large subunit pseudouridine synthase E [Filimonas sp.]